MPQVTKTAETIVAERCHMIGNRNPRSILQCNTYLRSFPRNGKGDIHWCVDPGSRRDYPVVHQNLEQLIGDIAALQLFTINHQDPDVCGNLTYFTSENPNLTGMVSEDTWRLVRHLDVHPKQLQFTNKVRKNLVGLPGGHRIQIVPTPFCHFRGAVAFYDIENRVLFSGDLFGGLNEPGRVQLLGEQPDWPGIAQFHQIYMPTRTAVAFAIRQVRALDPPVEIIAPQHGFVLRGDFMHDVLEWLETLPMGLDLLPSELDERYLDAYAEVFEEVLHEASLHLGREETIGILKRLPSTHELSECIEIRGNTARLMCKGIRALPLLVDQLSQDQFPEFRETLKTKVLRGCTDRKAPLPQVGVGVEEFGMQSGYWLG